ncbi:hypothetical protein RB195_007915 [Necator americanus]|uniref:Nicastrin n=1 Tax=Necator americanus TaxID=51031 RepID=A0ABR1BZI7_NECAM
MFILHSSLLFLSFTICRGEGLSDDIYVTIPVVEGVAGYRIFNGTHQFGFHTDSRGVVVMMKKGERAGLLDCWRSRFRGYLGKYHVVLSADTIDRSLVQNILESTCIAGLMITDPESNIDPSEPLSHDGVCPNPKSGVYTEGCATTNHWNEKGYVLSDGLRNIDWKMQILYLFNKTHVDAVKKCHDLFNVPKDGASFVSFPFCAASFGVFSTAAGSSEICYRRSKPWSRLFDLSIENKDDLCSPLVGVNVMAYLPPKVYNATATPYSARYLMLCSRMDSFGLIPEVSPGEVSVLTSVVALLTTTRAIGQHLDVFERAANTSNRHVIVAFFDGESFDYIGSSDTAYDMINGEFPRKLRSDLKAQLDPIIAAQLDSIVEVQQLGTGDGTGSLYAGADGKQYEQGKLDDLLKSLTDGAIAAGGSLVAPTKKSRMPPASWHSFARIAPSTRGVVLAPFRDEYNYRRINSILDRAQWTSGQRSAAITEIVIAARAMLNAAADHVGLDTAQKMALDIDKDFVSSLFECFIDEPDWFRCDFFKRINGGRFKASTAFYSGKSTYVSAGYRNPLRFFVEWLTTYAAGSTSYTSNVKDEKTCDDLGKDQNVYAYTWQADPKTGAHYCYRISMGTYTVSSPAFRIEGYDFSNGTYSTWTESLYNIDNLRLYLVEQESFEKVMLCLGIAIAIFSFLVVGRCSEESFIIDEGFFSLILLNSSLTFRVFQKFLFYSTLLYAVNGGQFVNTWNTIVDIIIQALCIFSNVHDRAMRKSEDPGFYKRGERNYSGMVCMCRFKRDTFTDPRNILLWENCGGVNCTTLEDMWNTCSSGPSSQ